MHCIPPKLCLSNYSCKIVKHILYVYYMHSIQLHLLFITGQPCHAFTMSSSIQKVDIFCLLAYIHIVIQTQHIFSSTAETQSIKFKHFKIPDFQSPLPGILKVSRVQSVYWCTMRFIFIFYSPSDVFVSQIEF